MLSFFPWYCGHSTRPRATAACTSFGAEVGVIRPAHRLDNQDCTTGRMVHIRRSKWPVRARGAGKTSGVGCAIPIWPKSMPCSGVPPRVPVRPGSSSCVHSYLKSTSTARMPHCRKTNDTLPFWWCIQKKVPAPPFAATGTDQTVASAISGNHDRLASGTATTALALQPCMCWSTTAIIRGRGKQKPKHAFAEPGMWLTSWPSASTPAVPSVWYRE